MLFLLTHFVPVPDAVFHHYIALNLFFCFYFYLVYLVLSFMPAICFHTPPSWAPFFCQWKHIKNLPLCSAGASYILYIFLFMPGPNFNHDTCCFQTIRTATWLIIFRMICFTPVPLFYSILTHYISLL